MFFEIFLRDTFATDITSKSSPATLFHMVFVYNFRDIEFTIFTVFYLWGTFLYVCFEICGRNLEVTMRTLLFLMKFFFMLFLVVAIVEIVALRTFNHMTNAVHFMQIYFAGLYFLVAILASR